MNSGIGKILWDKAIVDNFNPYVADEPDQTIHRGVHAKLRPFFEPLVAFETNITIDIKYTLGAYGNR